MWTVFAAVTLLHVVQGVSLGIDKRAEVLSYIYGIKPNAVTLPTLAGQLGDSTLVELVKFAGLVDALEQEGPFTLFAPTNAAFAALPESFMTKLRRNATFTSGILKYHVLPTTVYASQLSNDLLLPTLNGKPLRVNIYKNGQVVTVNGAKIISANQNASNGVLHQVDKALQLPRGNLAEIIKGCPLLSTLTQALEKADLATTLAGKGPFTVFAPMDEAFGKLPPGTLDDLLRNTTALTNLLTYHVLPKTLYSAGLENGPVKTVNGQNIIVQLSNQGVELNDNVKVILADVRADNGVAHAIDTVLVPKAMTFAEILNKPRDKFTYFLR